MPKHRIYKPLGNILLVWDRIGDYHAARYLELQKTVGNGNVFISDLGGADAIYKWKNPLSENPNYLPLSNKPVEKSAIYLRLKNFISIIRKKNIRIVGLAGYGRIEYLLILILSKFLGVQIVLFAESWYGANLLINRLKGFILNILCQGFLVSGKRAKEHFSNKLKIPVRKIEIGYSAVDNAHFNSQNGVKKENILLCVARFSEEKNLQNLIIAFKKSSLSKTWKLNIVGGGPLKETLQKEIGNQTNIQLSDWSSYSALPFIYAHASFFILPSKFEPWGLVANEAMAAGLPIALSTQCGCMPDLIDETEGLSFDGENNVSIINTLNKIALFTTAELEVLSKKNKEKIEEFSVHVWAKKFTTLASS